MALQHLRSSTADKRPTPAAMSDGQLALNTNLVSPGLFFKDSNGDSVKIGPVHVGTTAPNVTPGAGGQAGNSKGEAWLDTTATNPILKVWNGSAFVAVQPVGTGTVVSTTDSGTVTSTMILDGTILNADINASAAIVDTKLATIATAGKVSNSATTATSVLGANTIVARDGSNNFTAGTITAASFTIAANSYFALSGSDPIVNFDANDFIRYSKANNTYEFISGGAAHLLIGSTGSVGIGTATPGQKLDVVGTIRTSTGSDFFDIAQDGANGSLTNSEGNMLFYAPAGTAYIYHINGVEKMRLGATGDLKITQTPGAYTIDTAGGATSIANGGTVDFSSASGMLVANNYNTGAVTIYLCGGGFTSAVSTLGTQVGTLAYEVGINGYRWANNSGSTATFGFFFLRTRPGA